jgi:hypothetical protein
MTDYYRLIASAIAAAGASTDEERYKIYERAQAAQMAALQNSDPPFSESELERERLALEDAIRRVEIEAAEKCLPESSKSLSTRATADSESPRANSRLSLRTSKWLGSVPPNSENASLVSNRVSGVMGGLVSVIPAFIALIARDRRERNDRPPDSIRSKFALEAPSFDKRSGAAALLVIAALVIWTVVATYAARIGWLVTWVSANALAYMALLAKIAIMGCGLILVPLARFPLTRPMAKHGFIIASYLFGALTWILAVVATNYHLGLFWTLIGLATLFVGVVPLGIIGTAIRSDWMAAGLLVGGIAATCATRFAVRWLADKIDTERLKRT